MERSTFCSAWASHQKGAFCRWQQHNYSRQVLFSQAVFTNYLLLSDHQLLADVLLKRPVHVRNLRFHEDFPLLKHCLALGICGRALSASNHELPDVLALHTGFFQTRNDAERLDLPITESANTGRTFHVRKKGLSH